MSRIMYSGTWRPVIWQGHLQKITELPNTNNHRQDSFKPYHRSNCMSRIMYSGTWHPVIWQGHLQNITEVPNTNNHRQDSFKPYHKSTLSSVSEVKTLRTAAPCQCYFLYIFPGSKTSGARALPKFVLFKDRDSGFPFILPGRSCFILCNLH